MERYSEDTKQVVINVDDIQNIQHFMQFFEIPIPAYLQTTLDGILASKELTFEQQKDFRAKWARAILESKHPLFDDSAFDEVKKTMEVVSFEDQFESDLKEVLR